MDAVEVVIVALGQMASFRGAEVSAQTQALFAKRLIAEGCRVDDTVEACRRLELRERADGELSFPALATLLKEIGTVARQRREAARQDADRERDQLALAARYDVPTADDVRRQVHALRMMREAVSK